MSDRFPSPALPLFLPDDARIRVVGSFEGLVSTRFADGVNALCWRRELAGDFGEVVRLLNCGDGITPLDEETLVALPVGAAGRMAIDTMLADLERLEDAGLEPSLDCIRGYRRDVSTSQVSTDVFSFHVDSATAEADTYLCTYHGPSSEGLRNEDARRRVDVPETRAALRELYGDAKLDADFVAYLTTHHYDLHYVPARPEVKPYVFGVGNLWRIATQYPGSPVPPCIHRAPETRPGDEARLLLIS